MAEIKVYKEICKGCRMCIGACPKGILEMSRDLNAVGDQYCVQTNKEKCIGCAFCGMICPEAAIEVYR